MDGDSSESSRTAALGTLLRGVDPATRKELRRRCGADNHGAGARPGSGEWREEPKRLAPVSGYDLVFSCPKSVSFVHALTGDERVRREIDEAHETAWQAAVGYLEREACVVRRGHGGVARSTVRGSSPRRSVTGRAGRRTRTSTRT